jgi:HPr kinase/phosphorylase
MAPAKITVDQFVRDHAEPLALKLLAGGSGVHRVIGEPTVNRPGLILAGFSRYFAFRRIQVIGNAEWCFLKSLSRQVLAGRARAFFRQRIPCVVYSRNLRPHPVVVETAEHCGVPLFQTPLITMRFINLSTLALEMMFAPRATEMGSMVDILGMGVIIRGESGIGKSEAVLALIERGYSLVADDITHVTLVDGREVIGRSSEITRNHMEIRGIGIINVAAMFGVKSIRSEKRVDLVVSLRPWDEVSEVDRLGMEDEITTILGVPVPHLTIPVRPGRDLARLIEVAAFQTKLKKAGVNAAKELNDRLIDQMRRGA